MYRDALILHMATGLTARDVERIINRIDRRYNRLDDAGRRREARSRDHTIRTLMLVADKK